MELKMKKIIIFLFVLGLILGLCGCNRQIVDLTYKYGRAYIKLANGTIVEGKVASWRDYDDGDQIQVKIDNKTYLVHASNVTLIAE